MATDRSVAGHKMGCVKAKPYFECIVRVRCSALTVQEHYRHNSNGTLRGWNAFHQQLGRAESSPLSWKDRVDGWNCFGMHEMMTYKIHWTLGVRSARTRKSAPTLKSKQICACVMHTNCSRIVNNLFQEPLLQRSDIALKNLQKCGVYARWWSHVGETRLQSFKFGNSCQCRKIRENNNKHRSTVQ